jgi:DNA polymerase alpha subunit B
MADLENQINQYFAQGDSKVPQDVMNELRHIIQLLSISPEDLYYKWDSYVITMGAESTKLDYKTVRDFKKTLQDAFERDTRRSNTAQSSAKRVTATPRAAAMGGSDVFGIMENMVATPSSRNSINPKRKAMHLETPLHKSAKGGLQSSPGDYNSPSARRGVKTVAFESRQNSGEIIESLNAQLPASAVPEEAPSEARIKLKAAIDLPKFAYKPMAMKLSEASEILDDRIDSFTDLVQKHYELPDGDFGNAAAQSSAEIVAVGRIACSVPNGKLTSKDVVLETSRRMGAGMRVPLLLDGTNYDFFPGKIVALRGTNVGGKEFAVKEVLSMPLLPPAASSLADIAIHNDRQAGADCETRPLHILLASGPFTTDQDLSFAPLYALLERAEKEKADAIFLSGPFLDLEHPVVASGDFEAYLPPDLKVEPDRATILDIFRLLIGQHLQKLAQAVPSITIILVPSMRDAISKHVSWPQDRVPKPALGLPKQALLVANPMSLSINEMIFGMSSQDVLSELRRENVHQLAKGQPFSDDFLARLSSHVIEQSHFFPIFPPTAREALPKPAAIQDEVPEVGGEERLAMGASIDLTYLKLGEFWNARPDVLVLPSVLNPFAKVSLASSLISLILLISLTSSRL